MANRLAAEKSAYLLQHKDNPVDWFPWGDEAFQKAKRENKPVFLSVGYSSCHWCHVMEHESFEDEQVAHTLNTHFVSVKVDREERPDVDEAFMTAVHFSSGRGGWPMTVFMTADKEPFFAGTYFPKVDHGQAPGFLTIISQIALGWSSQRAEFEKAAKDFAKALREALTRGAPKTFTKLSPELIDNAIQALAAEFDGENGGFGAAPKFPSHTAIELLMTYGALASSREDLADSAVAMALVSLDRMSLGGIHDQVGGGFHRYSTDEHWLLPHFEKMLYDNALLLKNYGRAARLIYESVPNMSASFLRSASDIVAWLARDMASPEGLFYSAMDADSEGEEGKYYLWSGDEVKDLLGDRASEFMSAFNFELGGNYADEATKTKTGLNIPHLNEGVGDRFDEELRILLEAREKRPKPGIDDKCILCWNGLLLSGLAEVSEVETAERMATAILAAESALGSLPHQITKGTPSGIAFLDDYAAVALGLFDLSEALLEYAEEDPSAPQRAAKWRAEAMRLGEIMVQQFYDESEGGFFYTSSSHEDLFGRAKPAFDQPVPSGNGLAARVLLRMNDHERAERTLESMVGWIEKVPTATEELMMALLELNMLGKSEPSPVPTVEKKPPVGQVQVRLAQKEVSVGSEGFGVGEIVLEIPEGLHVNGHVTEARWLTPTTVQIQPLKAEIDFPEGTEYVGNTSIPFKIWLPNGETGADYEVTVSYQACTSTECQAPVEKRLNGVLIK